MAKSTIIRDPIILGVATGLALLFAGPAHGADATADAAAYTCANPASGASWPMRIDDRSATVDANPAKITGGQISWFDPTDGSYNTFDRASGNLTASIASSTGGYFRYAHCAPKTAK